MIIACLGCLLIGAIAGWYLHGAFVHHEMKEIEDLCDETIEEFEGIIEKQEEKETP